MKKLNRILIAMLFLGLCQVSHAADKRKVAQEKRRRARLATATVATPPTRAIPKSRLSVQDALTQELAEISSEQEQLQEQIRRTPLHTDSTRARRKIAQHKRALARLALKKDIVKRKLRSHTQAAPGMPSGTSLESVAPSESATGTLPLYPPAESE